MSERDEFEAWVRLTDAAPEVGQVVIVKSGGWSIPKVLRYLDKPYPRLSDPDSGRWYWYPERMRWAPVATHPQAVPALTEPVAYLMRSRGRLYFGEKGVPGHFPVFATPQQAVIEAMKRIAGDNVAQAEPMAWLVKSKRGMIRCAWTDEPSVTQLAVSEADGDTVTPLYAMPQQSVQALTDEQMKTLLKANGVEIWATQVDDAGPVMLTWGTLKRIISRPAAPQPSQEPERVMITEIPDGSIGMEGLQHNALLRRYQD